MMTKSTATKTARTGGKNPDSTITNVAFTKKNNPAAAFSTMNPSKYSPTVEAGPDVETLDPTDGLHELLYDGLKGMYWSEMHLTYALPKMVAAASSKALRTAIQKHLKETETHVARLEQVFELTGRMPKAKKCAAMEGLSMDGEAVVENTDAGSPARDLGIIMAGDKVEHHEIAAYTGLIKLAAKLGLNDVASLLESNLVEEQASSETLSGIAESDPAIGSAENNKNGKPRRNKNG